MTLRRNCLRIAKWQKNHNEGPFSIKKFIHWGSSLGFYKQLNHTEQESPYLEPIAVCTHSSGQFIILYSKQLAHNSQVES